MLHREDARRPRSVRPAASVSGAAGRAAITSPPALAGTART